MDKVPRRHGAQACAVRKSETNTSLLAAPTATSTVAIRNGRFTSICNIEFCSPRLFGAAGNDLLRQFGRAPGQAGKASYLQYPRVEISYVLILRQGGDKQRTENALHRAPSVGKPGSGCRL